MPKCEHEILVDAISGWLAVVDPDFCGYLPTWFDIDRKRVLEQIGIGLRAADLLADGPGIDEESHFASGLVIAEPEGGIPLASPSTIRKRKEERDDDATEKQ